MHTYIHAYIHAYCQINMRDCQINMREQALFPGSIKAEWQGKALLRLNGNVRLY